MLLLLGLFVMSSIAFTDKRTYFFCGIGDMELETPNINDCIGACNSNIISEL